MATVSNQNIKEMTLEEFYAEEWFLARPQHIKDCFFKFPVNQEWFLKNDKADAYYGVRIIGWDEHSDKEPTARIFIGSPVYPRNVFGIEPKDLYAADSVKDEPILFHTDPVLKIT